MRNVTIPLAALLVLALALPTLADPVNDGDRNFERAWRVYATRNNAKAIEYFQASAKAYDAAQAENPPSRIMRFQSIQVKAGISQYFAGEYDACIKTMEGAMGEKDQNNIWDAALFAALAQGKKGDKDAFLKGIDRFLNSASSQRLITAEVSKVLPGVKDGSMSPADAAAAIDKETQHQFVVNITRYDQRRGVSSSTESCDGSYWWRMNSRPCPQGRLREP